MIEKIPADFMPPRPGDDTDFDRICAATYAVITDTTDPHYRPPEDAGTFYLLHRIMAERGVTFEEAHRISTAWSLRRYGGRRFALKAGGSLVTTKLETA